MIFKFILLASLVKLLDMTESPFLCSGIYTAFVVALVAMSMMNLIILPLLIVAVISFALSSIYFLLLKRFKDTIFFWIILILGLFIGLV